jgi:hypothetical protein
MPETSPTRRPRPAPPFALVLSALLVAAAAGTAGCRGGSRDVVVRAAIPGPDSVQAPLAQLQVIALPYDRDSVRRAFERRGGPRPSTAAIDSLFARFRGPFVAYTHASAAVDRLRASAAAPGAPPALRTRLAAAERTRDSAAAALEVVRAELRQRDSALRAPIRQWEDSTFRGWDSVTQALVKARDRDPLADSTDATGRVTLHLPKGDWWIWATSLDVGDPNARWYWNVPVRGDTVVLDRTTGQLRPRY